MASLSILVPRATAMALLGLACVATLALAQTPATGDRSPSGVIASPPPSEAELARQQSFDRYQLELVAGLARGSDARQLLAAAMYSPRTSFGRSTEDVPGPLRFDTLLKRAQESGPDVPIVWWMSAMEACRPGTDKPCPESTAVRHLIEIDSDNAASWVLEFNRAALARDVESQRRALSMAARARRYDDYTWALEKLLLSAAMSGPPVPAGVTDHPPGLDAAGAHKHHAFVTSFGTTLAVTIPSTQPLTDTCAPPTGATLDPALRADCADVGKAMATGATSAIGQFLGLRLWQRMGLLSESEFDRLHRDWQWRNHGMGPEAERMIQDSAGIDRFVRLAQESDTEAAFQRSLLHEAGKPPSPPDDWQPAQPQNASHSDRD